MKVLFVTLLLYIEFAVVFSFAFPKESNTSCPKIISRSRWGARDAKTVENCTAPVKYVIIHHTVTPICSDEEACSKRLESIQRYHMKERGFEDIAYNFIIGGDGQVYAGRGWHIVGAHTMGWNVNSIGIGFVGNFTTDSPASKQLDACQRLIQCAVELGELDEEYKLLGARSVRNTLSPGDALFRIIQEWKGFTRRS